MNVNFTFFEFWGRPLKGLQTAFLNQIPRKDRRHKPVSPSTKSADTLEASPPPLSPSYCFPLSLTAPPLS